MRPALVIGITGGIGSGKTTVADLFSSLGVPVIDADVVARQVVVPGQPAYEEILGFFGSEVALPSGELDRKQLRERAFSDPAARVRLEEIVHPRVYGEMKQQLDSLDTAYAIVVVPLLIESGGRDLVDRVLVVDSPQQLQIARTERRDGTSPDIIERILAAQLDRDARLSTADDIIDNDATLEALTEAVHRLDRQYRDEAARIASERPEMKE